MASLWSGAAHAPSQEELFSKGLFLDRAIEGRIQVQVVHNVDIEPKQKTIYFQGEQNPFSFLIREGSGEFQVTINDTSVAEKQVEGREVRILPKREGSLRITVEDLELPRSKPVSAVLHFSDVASLQLNSKVHLIE